MRIRLYRPGRIQGSVLMVTLLLALLLGLALASYLRMVSAQTAAVARSQAWNNALGVAEAGVEEALAQLNPAAMMTNVLGGNGWTLYDGLYRPEPVKRQIGNGYYFASYTPTTPPIIYVTGYTTVPTLSATLARVLEVTTTNAPMFSGAIAVSAGIDLYGNPLSVDSFDSSDPAFSTWGRWDPAKPRKANGDIATTTGFNNAGTIDLDGDLWLGPNAAYALPGGTTIAGTVNNDYNGEFPDMAEPAANWLNLAQQSYSNQFGNFQYALLSSGDYVVNGYVNRSIYVGANTHVRLKIMGDVAITNTSSSIRLSTNNASLEIYMLGGKLNVKGRGIINDTGKASNLSIYGLPGNTNIILGGTNDFIGTVYAPQADLVLQIGATNNGNFIGAAVSRSVIISGRAKFHYDENLGRQGPARGYLARSWRELPPSQN